MKLLWIISIVFLPFVFGNRLKRVENRLELVQNRLDLESISRRDDKSEITQRLDTMEMRLNTSEEISTKCCDVSEHEEFKETEGFQSESDSATNFEFMTLAKAFDKEKLENVKSRRRLPKIEKQMYGVRAEVTKVFNDIASIRETITSLEISFEKNELKALNPSFEQLETIIETVTENIEGKIKSDLINIIEAIGTSAGICSQAHNTNKKSRENIDLLMEKMTNLELKLDGMSKYMIDGMMTKPQSCFDLYGMGKVKNGLYDIFIGKRDTSVRVFCDMQTDGGGWTVFQRRMDGSVDFYRDWEDYESGFGDMTGEFWLGNDYISALTNGPNTYELRIDMEDFDGDKRYAKYESFQVQPKSENYTLTVGNYSGDAGDSFSYQSNQQFTTIDRDNDKDIRRNCASAFSGAWWYNNCHYSNLNGLYSDTRYGRGVNWRTWRGYNYSLKMTEMKLR